MNAVLHWAWDDFIGPMLQRPKRLQVAALCHRKRDHGPEYLLITSRETRRWIIPKGWPIRGLKSNETALQEAWEEAGVKSKNVSPDPVGRFTYQKRTRSGFHFPVETLVYAVAVDDLASSYPEADERTRKWVTADVAATMVDEIELRQLFRSHVGTGIGQTVD